MNARQVWYQLNYILSQMESSSEHLGSCGHWYTLSTAKHRSWQLRDLESSLRIARRRDLEEKAVKMLGGKTLSEEVCPLLAQLPGAVATGQLAGPVPPLWPARTLKA